MKVLSKALRRKGGTAIQLPLAVLALMPLAWLMIGFASAAIALVPFRRLAPLLGRNLGATSLMPIVPIRVLPRAVQIRTAIAIAAKYAPFRSDCLPQALVAATLCRWGRVPYAVHFGAALANQESRGKLLAHAWVQAGPVAITGGTPSFRTYGVVACFVPPRMSAGATSENFA